MAILVVQLGHCYRRTGATGTAGEQEFATRAGAACADVLHGRGGWQVRQILADTTKEAYRGDAFVAIHCDGSTNTGARGASVGYRTPEGQAFGQDWKRDYQARGWSGFRPDNYTAALSGYYGTGYAREVGNRRAIIIECGFLTNPQDRAILLHPDSPYRVARAIGDALGIPHEPAPPPPTPLELSAMRNLILVKKKGTQEIWAGDGIHRFHIPNTTRLSNIQHWMKILGIDSKQWELLPEVDDLDTFGFVVVTPDPPAPTQ